MTPAERRAALDTLGLSQAQAAPVSQWEPIGFREELTKAGPQYVIPVCDRVLPETGRPQQLGLW